MESNLLCLRHTPSSSSPLRIGRNVVGEKEGRADRSKEGRKEGRTGRSAISLCVFDAGQSLVPGKFTVWLAANKCRLPTSPLFSRLPVRSATISSYYRNIRFNGERQGITMRDTTPPLPRDETRHFPSGNLFFFFLFFPLFHSRAASNALPALIRPALCFHFNGVQCMYGCVGVELEEAEEVGMRISIESIVAEDAVLGFGGFVFVNGSEWIVWYVC